MQSINYELIIVISNQGFVDEIMDTAKKAGARGGTIIHGKGTADEETAKFFGLTIQQDKELLLIVTKTIEKNKIMQAIVDNHGLDTNSRALCFSLPVTDVCGFNF